MDKCCLCNRFHSWRESCLSGPLEVRYQGFQRCRRCGDVLKAHQQYCQCGAYPLELELLVINLDVLASYGYLLKGKAEADLKADKPKRLEDLRKAQDYLGKLIKLVEDDGKV